MEYLQDPFSVICDLEGNPVYTQHVIKYQATYGFPLYSQRDPQWAGDQLGYGTTTIGQQGCLVTALSEALTVVYQEPITPNVLNEKLKEINGFSGSNLYWTRVTKAYPSFQFVERVYCKLVPAPAAEIETWLGEGQYVVVEIDMNLKTKAVDQHWLLLVGGDKDQFVYHDPWLTVNQQEARTMPPGYCKQDWDPARAIFQYARYRMTP